MLLDAGANPSAIDHRGTTPLHETAQSSGCLGMTSTRHRRLAVVRMLLAAGADPSAKDNDGTTPLHDAYLSINGTESGGAGDVAKMLLDAGTDVSATNKEGFSFHTTCRLCIWQQWVL